MSYMYILGYIALTALTLLCVAVCLVGVSLLLTYIYDWWKN